LSENPFDIPVWNDFWYSVYRAIPDYSGLINVPCDSDCDSCVDKYNCPDSPSFVDPTGFDLEEEEPWNQEDDWDD
jgi:hypothetical protein